MMYDGKKSVAEGIVYGALRHHRRPRPSRIRWRCSSEALEQRRAADRSAVPPCRRRDLSGAGRSSSPTRRQALAIRWLICRRARPQRKDDGRAACRPNCSTPRNNRGNAVKKREDTHRMAEANRAFAHYRW
jgi:small subunit ribosomal protein S7